MRGEAEREAGRAGDPGRPDHGARDQRPRAAAAGGGGQATHRHDLPAGRSGSTMRPRAPGGGLFRPGDRAEGPRRGPGDRGGPRPYGSDRIRARGPALSLRPRLGIVCQTTATERRVEAIRTAIAAAEPGRRGSVRRHGLPADQGAPAPAGTAARAGRGGGGRGRANSNNTRELVARCRRAGPAVVHVQSAADLDPEWFAGFDTVGLTAGTSTLDARSTRSTGPSSASVRAPTPAGAIRDQAG